MTDTTTEISDLEKTRVAELVDARIKLAAHEAQIAELREQLEEALYAQRTAEDALFAIDYDKALDRAVYVPGSDEPDPVGSMVLVSLDSGAVFYRDPKRAGGGFPWRRVGFDGTSYDWDGVLEDAPLIDATGHSSDYLVRHCTDTQEQLRGVYTQVLAAARFLDWGADQPQGAGWRDPRFVQANIDIGAGRDQQVADVVDAFKATVRNMQANPRR